MKFPHFFLVLLFLSVVAKAQTLDHPVGVPVRIWASANCLNPPSGESAIISINASVLPTTDCPDGAFGLVAEKWSSGSYQSPTGTARLEPGKIYYFSVSAAYSNLLRLFATPPPGYSVEIEGMARRSCPVPGVSPDTVVSVRVSKPSDDSSGSVGTASSLSNGRLFWQVSMGGMKNGSSARNLSIIDSGLSDSWDSIFTPASLQYEAPDRSEIYVFHDSGNIRQIFANEAAVDVVTLSADSFELRFYNPSQAQGTTYPRTFTGLPFITYRIAKDGSSTKLKITSESRTITSLTDINASIVRSASTTIERTGTSTAYSWKVTDWTTVAVPAVAALAEDNRVWETNSSGNRTESLSVKDPSSTSKVLSQSKVFHQYDWGEEILSRTEGSSTNSISTDYSYYEQASDTSSYGFVKSISSPSTGSWEAFEYLPSSSQAGAGKIARRHRPFGGTPASVPDNLALNIAGEITTYEYVADPFEMLTRPSLIEAKVGATTVSKSVIAYTTTTANSKNVVVAQRDDYSGSSSFVRTITKYYQEDVADAFFRNQIHSVTKPDGSKHSYVYQKGSLSGSTFTVDSSGLFSRIATLHGSSTGTGLTSAYSGYAIDPLYLISGKSTMDVVIRDANARVCRTETHVWNGTVWVLVDASVYQHDYAGHLTGRTTGNGGQYSAVYAGELRSSETDETGVQTSYEYDAAARVSNATKEAGSSGVSGQAGYVNIPALRTQYSYDAANHLKSITRGPEIGEKIVSSCDFDDAGRLTSKVEPGIGTTSFSYNPSTRQTTVTLPTLATRIETRERDGRLSSITGTAVVPEYYTYRVDEIGAATLGYLTTQVNVSTASSSRAITSVSDWLGRTVSSSRPGFAQPTASAPLTFSYVYNSASGLLQKTTHSGDSVIKLYEYDSLGNLTRSGLDLNANDALDTTSDRISETQTSFVLEDSVWWKVTRSSTYFTNTATLTSLGQTAMQLTGLSNGNSVVKTTDIEGRVETATVTVDRASKLVTATVTGAGLNDRSSVMLNGLLVSQTGADGVTVKTGYDALHRPSQTVHPRTGTSTLTYWDGTSLPKVLTDAAEKTIWTRYYDAGRLSAESNGLGKTARYEYNARGQILHVWGNAATPVTYEYNSYGEQTRLYTYQDATLSWNGTTWPTGVTTSTSYTNWDYDAASGFLWKKTDAAGKYVEFGYDSAGRLQTRKWARTIGDPAVPVTATYAYVNTTGELFGVSYNDSTAAVGYTYLRSGQLDTVTDFTGLRSLVYDPAKPWRLSGADEGAFYNNRVMTCLYNESGLVGSSKGFQLGTASALNAEGEQSFTLDAAGRVSTVLANLSASNSRTYTYGYEANSSLVGGYTSGSLSVDYDYEAHRDLRTKVESKFGTVLKSRYDYTYNDLQQRDSAKQSGTAFADYIDSTYLCYAYNDRGELTNAATYRGESVTAKADGLQGRYFDYEYDAAGNRTSANHTGDASLKELFSRNSLNQYTGRENHGVSVSGTSDATAKVMVRGNTVLAGRSGKFFSDEVAVNNTTAPFKGPLTILIAKTGTPDVVYSESRTAILPMAAQVLQYDDDGNLKDDGMWMYQYDAENRLVRMESTSASRSAGIDYRVLEFRYDYQGRRVQRSACTMAARAPSCRPGAICTMAGTL